MLLKKQAKRAAKYFDLLNSDLGKEVLADMCDRHFMLTTTHVPHDPHTTAFNEGRRAVIAELIQLAGTSPLELQEKIKLQQKEDGRNSRDGIGESDFGEF